MENVVKMSLPVQQGNALTPEGQKSCTPRFGSYLIQEADANLRKHLITILTNLRNGHVYSVRKDN